MTLQQTKHGVSFVTVTSILFILVAKLVNAKMTLNPDDLKSMQKVTVIKNNVENLSSKKDKPNSSLINWTQSMR